MLAALSSWLPGVEAWARVRGLQILLICIGAVLVARFVHWFSGSLRTRMQSRVLGKTSRGEIPTDAEKRLQALTQAGEWAAVSLVYFIATILVLLRLGIPLTTLVAPATVIGFALGFGAQGVVQDILAGLFLFSEHQFGIGDLIQVAPPGSTSGTMGTVEELTLRVTKLRALGGELVMMPNSSLGQVTNLSRGRAQVVVDVPIPSSSDVSRALSVLVDVSEGLAGDMAFRAQLIEAPTVTGVESMDLSSFVVRMVARTLPGQKWSVARELRKRALVALREAGVIEASSGAPG